MMMMMMPTDVGGSSVELAGHCRGGLAVTLVDSCGYRE